MNNSFLKIKEDGDSTLEIGVVIAASNAHAIIQIESRDNYKSISLSKAKAYLLIENLKTIINQLK